MGSVCQEKCFLNVMLSNLALGCLGFFAMAILTAVQLPSYDICPMVLFESWPKQAFNNAASCGVRSSVWEFHSLH